MTQSSSWPSDLTLERYRLGELPAAAAERVAARAAVDPALKARLEALADSDRDIRDRYGDDWPARAVAARFAGRPARLPAIGGPAWPSLVAMAASLVLVVSAAVWVSSPGGFIWPAAAGPDRTTPAGTSGSVEETRVKGEAAVLLLYRKTGTSSERLADGDAARAGDLVRVAYRAASPRFGVIVSVDGRGVVTRHLPASGAGAVRLQPGEPTPLADAYELDDAPRWEQFYLITSETPFDVQLVVDAARGVATGAGASPPAALSLPSGLDQSSFLLRKTP